MIFLRETFSVHEAPVEESVIVAVPLVMLAVTLAVAWVSEITVTVPIELMDGLVLVKVGGLVVQLVKVPVNVTVAVAPGLIRPGEHERVGGGTTAPQYFVTR